MIIPCGHRVMVKLHQLEDYDPVFKSAKQAGFELPEFSRRKEETIIDTGVVVRVGKTAWKAFDDGHAWCEVGDTIAYARHSGKKVKDPDTEEVFLILNDEDVVAIIRKTENG